ncbi:hypothetical protein C6P40_001825 [Pichia californica]|uniref:Uncharacterized protein n=1 Tax=Pichia californica TaxID=460514 RepID=A0A9P6WJ02_9ASCO|nr:hypothetical protein C6P42_001744 [[Candida] californica]KAG0687821.1 hypothetical protein C6P40_001825 [[Candida] californica]
MSLLSPFKWAFNLIYKIVILILKISLFILAISIIIPIAITLFNYLKFYYTKYESTLAVLLINYLIWRANRDLIAKYYETYFFTNNFSDSKILNLLIENLQKITIYFNTLPEYSKYNLSLPDYGNYNFNSVNTSDPPRIILTKLSTEILGKKFNPYQILNDLSINDKISKDYIIKLNNSINNNEIKSSVDFKIFNIKYFYPDIGKLNARLDSYHLAFLEVTINSSKGFDRFLNYWIDRGHYLSFQNFNRTFSNSLEFGPFKNFNNKDLLCYVASISYDIQEFLYNLKNMNDISNLIQSTGSTYDLLFKSRIFHHNYLRFKNPKCVQPISINKKPKSIDNKNNKNQIETKNLNLKLNGVNYHQTKYNNDIPIVTTGVIQVTPVFFDNETSSTNKSNKPENESTKPKNESPHDTQEQYFPYKSDKDNYYLNLYITDDYLTKPKEFAENESYPVLIDKSQQGSYVGETYLYFEGIKSYDPGHNIKETFFDGKKTHKFPSKFVDFTIQLDGKLYHNTLSVIPYDVDPGFTLLLGLDFLNKLPENAPKPKKQSEM